MSLEQRFSQYPTPWRMDATDRATLVDANDQVVLVVDPNNERDDASVFALSEWLADLANVAGPRR